MTLRKAPSYRLQKFLCWLGIIPFGASALIFIPMFVVDIVNGNYKGASETAESELTGIIGGSICAGFIPAAMAILLLVRLFRLQRKEKQESEALVQDSILEFAVASGGKLTAVELATHLNVPASEATVWLNLCVSRGLAKLQVSESGVMVYFFDQIISRDEKDRAETV